MIEAKTAKLLPWPAFRRRLVRHGIIAMIVLGASLAVGVAGFWWLGDQAPIDALENSAMLLGGMGPVGEIRSTAGKLFASFYALYAGMVFLGTATVLFAPIFHRILIKFHLEEQEQLGEKPGGQPSRPQPRGGAAADR
jgi:hypothetical protein